MNTESTAHLIDIMNNNNFQEHFYSIFVGDKLYLKISL